MKESWDSPGRSEAGSGSDSEGSSQSKPGTGGRGLLSIVGAKTGAKAEGLESKRPTSLEAALAEFATRARERQEKPAVASQEVTDKKLTSEPEESAKISEPAQYAEQAQPTAGTVPQIELLHTRDTTSEEEKDQTGEEKKQEAPTRPKKSSFAEISLDSPSGEFIEGVLLDSRAKKATSESEDSKHSEYAQSEADSEYLPEGVAPTVADAESGWNMQAQMQHQAHDYEVPQPEQTPDGIHTQRPTATSMPNMEVPSVSSPETSNPLYEDERTLPLAATLELTDDIPETTGVNPNENEWIPADAYRRYTKEHETEVPGIYATGEQPVSRKELDDAVYDAARAGQGRGLVTGLFVAGVWGHFRRKGLKRQINTQRKQLQQTQAELRSTQTEQTQHAASVELRLGDAQRETRATETQLERVTRRLKGAEQRFEELRRSAVRAVKGSEQAPAEEPQSIKLAENQRLERSAWLTTVVDKDTGRPVETPVFEYGHEYYHERAAEGRPTVLRNSAAGEVALVAAARAAVDGTGATPISPTTAAPGSDIPSATMQGPPPSHQAQSTEKDTGLPIISSKTGPVWPYLLALVVIFICLIVLLR